MRCFTVFHEAIVILLCSTLEQSVILKSPPPRDITLVGASFTKFDEFINVTIELLDVECRLQSLASNLEGTKLTGFFVISCDKKQKL